MSIYSSISGTDSLKMHIGHFRFFSQQNLVVCLLHSIQHEEQALKSDTMPSRIVRQNGKLNTGARFNAFIDMLARERIIALALKYKSLKGIEQTKLNHNCGDIFVSLVQQNMTLLW